MPYRTLTVVMTDNQLPFDARDAAPSPSFHAALATRLKLGAAVFGGFLLGTTGLATAGALGPLQPIAASVAESVAPVSLPQGPSERAQEAKQASKEAKAARAAEGKGGGVERAFGPGCNVLGVTEASNHGQYLKAVRAAGASEEQLATAAASDCGKPVNSVGKPEADDDDEAVDVEGEKGDHGKSADAPGQANKGAGANNGKSDEDHGQSEASDKGKSDEDHGKAEGKGAPDVAGRSGVTPPPESTPVTPAPAEDPGPPAGDDAPASDTALQS